MGREFEVERKKVAIDSFLCHSSAFSYTKLRSNRNQAQTLRFVFNPRIIIPCSLREYMPANDKLTELK